MPAADNDDYHEDIDLSGPLRPGERVISCNLAREQRPGGMKVRYKIKIASGARAREIGARQAKVMLEVLQWMGNHPHQQEQAGHDQSAQPAAPPDLPRHGLECVPGMGAGDAGFTADKREKD